MPKANAESITKPIQPPNVELREKRNSKRYLAMESDVYDIGEMTNATAIILDEFMEEYRGIAGMDDVTAAQMAEHLTHWSAALDFMVHHLDATAKALRKHYENQEGA